MKLRNLVPLVFTLTAGAALAQDGAVPRDDERSAANRSAAERSANERSSSRSGEAAAELGSSEHPDFATADTDKDGLLSIAEVQAALPDLKLTDENADGFVNQSEAESAVAGLAFESSGFTGGSTLVSEPEYGLMVSTLGEDAADDAGESSTPPRSSND